METAPASQSIDPSKSLTAGTKTLNGLPLVLNFINGTWVQSRGSSVLPVMNPAIGQHIADVPLSTAQDIDDAARSAEKAFAS